MKLKILIIFLLQTPSFVFALKKNHIVLQKYNWILTFYNFSNLFALSLYCYENKIRLVAYAVSLWVAPAHVIDGHVNIAPFGLVKCSGVVIVGDEKSLI